MTDTSPENADIQADDEARFDALGARSDYAHLPGIHRAMWHGDVRFDTDLNEYNDRFIETNVAPEGVKFVLYLASGWHTLGFFSAFVGLPVFAHKFDIENLFVYLFGLVLPGIIFWVASGIARGSDRIRFNRQAQVVHIVEDENTVHHLPWRDVRPYAYFSTSSDLTLAFPIPPILRDRLDAKTIRRSFRNEPFFFRGTFDRYDRGIRSNLMRLEFIRRYMEEGLSAVQPHPDVTPRKPTGDVMAPDNPDGSRSTGTQLLRVFYWFGLGPLVDRWVDYKSSQFKWPEEVERLCAPGADLSGFDTRVVKPSKDIFYRPDASGYHLCNRNGERIQA